MTKTCCYLTNSHIRRKYCSRKKLSEHSLKHYELQYLYRATRIPQNTEITYKFKKYK